MKTFTADYIRTLKLNKERLIELYAAPIIEKLENRIEKTACAGGSWIDYEIDCYNHELMSSLDFIINYFKDRGFEVDVDYNEDPVAGLDTLIIKW